jgi:hypothetical protein
MSEPLDIEAERKRRELREKLRKLCELEGIANRDGNYALAQAARADRQALERGAA